MEFPWWGRGVRASAVFRKVKWRGPWCGVFRGWNLTWRERGQYQEEQHFRPGNLIRRRRNQHNALTIAGQASKASTRGRIEAIREKTVSIFRFFLAVEIWPLLHFCQRRGSWFQRPHKVKWWKFYLFIYFLDRTEKNHSTWIQLGQSRFYQKGNRKSFFSCLLSLSHMETTPPMCPLFVFLSGREKFYLSQSIDSEL